MRSLGLADSVTGKAGSQRGGLESKGTPGIISRCLLLFSADNRYLIGEIGLCAALDRGFDNG